MKSVPPYPQLGALVADRRRRIGQTQPAFAERAGVSQQTVSRWEQGLSRPRLKELPGLAALLKVDLGELQEAAEYFPDGNGKGTPGAPTYDIDLPLHYLSPQAFENFCMELLRRLYRDRGAAVNRFGGPGSKQGGIDIEVRGDSFVHTFQCKQVKNFGETKVAEAVAKHNFKSDLKVLLLSTTASPGARKTIATHPDWQLWDRNDISSRFRDLPKVARRDLVDTYFRGQRRALLGETEAGPFQTFEEFYKQYSIPHQYFNHTWELVGREEELASTLDAIGDSAFVATLLIGPPGNGKSRLVREVIEQFKGKHPQAAIWFASATEDVKLQHLQELGPGAKLLVIDDAHDRDDLGQLFNYAAVPENNARLLLALRPYGRTMVESTAALAGVQVRQLATVELRKRTKADAKELAEMVLSKGNGPLQAAEEIAELSVATPLVTVLAAQIVARERMPVAMIGNSEDFQLAVLGRLQEVIAGEIVTGADAPKMQAVLRVSALLQPVVFDDPALLNIFREVEDLEEEDLQRMLRVLTEAGVLFRRGLRHRIAPDLLADHIIQQNFIGSNGTVTSKVHKIFDIADVQYLTNLLVNLGRLDWRLKAGAAQDSELLEALSPKLKWHGEYHHPHVEAMEAVAYYQPRLALSFAERLIEEGHGQASGVCGMVRNAAYNFEVLEDSCLLLWRAGKSDQRPLHQQPSHGVRILKELAEFEPYKPVQYVEGVVDFALKLLQRPMNWEGPYTPFDILEGALRTDMENMSATGNQITISRYRLDFDVAKKVRKRVIDTIIDCLQKGPLRKAFLAAAALSEALRNPMHAIAQELEVWNRVHAEVLTRVLDVLKRPETPSAVLMRAAMSVTWHAHYNDGAPSQEIAREILGLLGRDLQTRVTRLLVDAWGSDTWEDDETFERKAHQADLKQAIEDLAVTFPSAGSLCDFLEQTLEHMSAGAGGGWGTPQLFIGELLHARPDLAQEVMVRQSQPEGPMARFAGAALAVCMRQQDGHKLVSKILDSDSRQAWELVSEAYARRPAESLGDDDLAIIRRIFTSSHPFVLIHAATIARNLANKSPALAVELIATADFSLSPAATRDFLMWMSHSNTIPTQAVSSDDWEKLLGKVGQMERLDDHWTQAFLKKAVAAQPSEVIEMFKHRLKSSTQQHALWPVRHERSGNGFGLLKHEDGFTLLRDFLRWSVEQKAASDFSTAVGAVVSAFCGKYNKDVLQMLFDMLKAGGQHNLDVVASVLRGAHQEFVIEETPFVKDALNQAELIGEQAVKDLSSALWAATLSGGRSGAVGEPFMEDLRLEQHCTKVLQEIGRLDPAYSLYSGLLRDAQDNIERQRRTKRAMQEVDE